MRKHAQSFSAVKPMNCPIIITGVGKRIGLHLAKHFLQQGMPVVGTYRSHYASIDELKQLGCDVYSLDFYCQDQLDTFIEAIKAKYPQLRGIIHNASDWLPDSDTLPRQEIFNKMMLVHASVPYQLNLGFRDLLQKGEGSSRDIIHLTDYVAQTGSKKHMAYAASKAALENLTLSFASLFAPEVKVNSIAPRSG